MSSTSDMLPCPFTSCGTMGSSSIRPYRFHDACLYRLHWDTSFTCCLVLSRQCGDPLILFRRHMGTRVPLDPLPLPLAFPSIFFSLRLRTCLLRFLLSHQ